MFKAQTDICKRFYRFVEGMHLCYMGRNRPEMQLPDRGQ